MNSLLYLAETRMTEDFSYLLMFELIKYIDSKNKSNISSFYEFLEKKLN